jgi:hypothetical protein
LPELSKATPGHGCTRVAGGPLAAENQGVHGTVMRENRVEGPRQPGRLTSGRPAQRTPRRAAALGAAAAADGP